MCGRFSLVDPQILFERFGLQVPPSFKPRYNIAPTQDCLVISPDLQLRTMRWGLIPSWAKDPKIAYSTINARAESVAEKPAFRDSFKKRRCLVPADGYYEWLTPGGKAKLPMRFTLKSGEPFCFAGLWDNWKHEDAEPLQSFTILTSAADKIFEHFHDREPVILSKEQGLEWMDPKTPSERLVQLMQPFPASELKGYEVSKIVNSGRNEVPDCVVPAGDVKWP